MKKIEEQTTSPLAMASDIKTIKENFGKNAIIIKNNLVFRCSTEVLERGPKCLNDLLLPKYGKMNKFIVTDEGVFQLVCTEENPYVNGTFAQYEIGDKVEIDVTNIVFDVNNVWNKAKEKVVVEKVEA